MISRRLFIAGAMAWGQFAAPSSVLASGRPRIAIVADSDSLRGPELDRFVNQLTGIILRSGHFDVVDRKRLSAIIAEQGFSNSQYSDPQTAAALGKIAGASRLLAVQVTVDDSESSGTFMNVHTLQVNATYSMVGVDSAKIVAAGNAEGDLKASSPAESGMSPFSATAQRGAILACAQDLADQIDAT